MPNDCIRSEGDVGPKSEAGEALARSGTTGDDAAGTDIEGVVGGLGTSGSTGDLDSAADDLTSSRAFS